MMSAQPADIFLLLLGNPGRGAHATCCCQKEQLSPSQEQSPPGCSKHAGNPQAGHHSLLYFRALLCRPVEYQLNLRFKVRARIQH